MARFIDKMVVSATKPIRHSTGLSISVVFSAQLVGIAPLIFRKSLTIVTEQFHKTEIRISNAHEEDLGRIVWSGNGSVKPVFAWLLTHSI